MTKKLYLILAIVLAALIVLAGCQRSASTAPLATATQGSPSVPQNVGGGATEDPMKMLQLYATQTAMYAAGLPTATPTVPGQTPASGGTAITPMASATNTSVVPGVGQPTNTPVVIATTPVATTVVTRPATYTLQIGEYPYCIARRFNVNPNDLLALNGLTNGQLFQPGLTLKIPSIGTFPGSRALHTHPGTYIVVADDTIYKIACYYGDVDPLTLASVNKLVAPYKLTVGQNLSIP
jgi:LysM repeat protein